MNAYQLYEKTAKIRDEYRDAHRVALCDKCNEVFTQMLAAAFTNKCKSDELPKVFKVYEVSFRSDELKKLMVRIGLNVEVELIKNDYVRGNSFTVTQLSTEA